MLLFRQLEICPSNVFATMVDCIGNELLRIVQISIYNAHKNQTIQRGKDLRNYGSCEIGFVSLSFREIADLFVNSVVKCLVAEFGYVWR